jgi:hypothetical protein
MNRNLHILNELREQAPALAEISPLPVFLVPDGYFDGLAGDILLKINSENSVLPSGPAKKTGFEVPSGYFDNLAGSILNRIKTEEVTGTREETAALSPILAGISREMPFQVPTSYFDQLPERMLNQNKEAKVISMGNRGGGRIISRWIKFAAAACITGVLAFGAYRMLNTGNGEKGEMPDFAKSPTVEQIKNFDLDSELEKLSSTDLTDYLCATGDIACNNDKKDEELTKQLSEISDEDLSKYLEGTN